DERGDALPHLRPLLHHQAAGDRTRHGARPVGHRSARGRARRAQRAGQGDARDDPAAARGRRMRNTILVVDDEASIADGLRLTLEAEGYSVRIAGSVRTALASVAQSDPHVAIVDLMLPDGDGLTLTRELKQRDPALEVRSEERRGGRRCRS